VAFAEVDKTRRGGVLEKEGWSEARGYTDWRMACESIKAGALGEIKEFHSWTNRPGWPQGGDRPDWTDPVPEYLD
jgi:hypothetical protein